MVSLECPQELRNLPTLTWADNVKRLAEALLRLVRLDRSTLV